MSAYYEGLLRIEYDFQRYWGSKIKELLQSKWLEILIKLHRWIKIRYVSSWTWFSINIWFENHYPYFYENYILNDMSIISSHYPQASSTHPLNLPVFWLNTQWSSTFFPPKSAPSALSKSNLLRMYLIGLQCLYQILFIRKDKNRNIRQFLFLIYHMLTCSNFYNSTPASFTLFVSAESIT